METVDIGDRINEYLLTVNDRIVGECIEEWDRGGSGYYDKFIKIRWLFKWGEWMEKIRWN